MSAPGIALSRALSLRAGTDWLFEQSGERIFRAAGRDVMFDLVVAALKDECTFLAEFLREADGPVRDKCGPWFEVAQ